MRSSSARVLILSVPEDVHVPYVTRHLSVADYIVLSPLHATLQGELSFRWHKGRLVACLVNERLDAVKSVWYRKPGVGLDTKLPVPDAYQQYSQLTIRYFTSLLNNCFPDALCVSDYYAMQRAENKAWQLTVAKELGFQVPDTLITANVNEARKFLHKHGTVIAKPLQSGLVTLQGKHYSFGASKLTDKQLIANLHTAPAIFQQSIQAAYDIRVTVVGARVFAGKIHLTDTERRSTMLRDWRRGYARGEAAFQAYSLPEPIAQLCIRHVQQLGLQHGELDLIKDTAGIYWFIENNPNGQWAFVEQDTGLAIGKAFADLLIGEHG